MNYYNSAEEAVDKAYAKINAGKYDVAVEIYQDALAKFNQFRLNQPTDQESQYDQMQQAIEEELRVAEQISETFKNTSRPRITENRCDSDDEAPEFNERNVHQSPFVREAEKRNFQHQMERDTPSKWNQNAARPRYQEKSVTPAKESKITPKAGARQGYDKPWQEPAKPAKEQEEGDGLPTAYEGVELEYIPMIHNLMLKKTNVAFSDIAGLETAKSLLSEAIIWPIKTPAFYEGVNPTKGCLLFGPPGTGKTKLVKAIATEAGCTFFAPTSATIMNKMVGDSEKVVQALFKIARFHAPSIVFLDEIDALLSAGSHNENDVSKRIREEFLTQMEGVTTGDFDIKTHVLVIGATNHPESLDEALRRRLQKRIHIPMPELESRLEMLKLFTRNEQLDPDVDFQRLADELNGYNGSDIYNICEDAKMASRRRLYSEYSIEELQQRQDEFVQQLVVKMEDFEQSIKKIKSSVSSEDIQKAYEFEKRFAAE